MNKVSLYIKDSDGVFQLVELFEDETISVTSKIQDIRDISKVFTDFSQSFTLPASKKNNKIFKHFYNYFISSDDAFDARKKVDAQLEINHIPFRDGKILLNSVKMKDNKPYAYNVTFFGNTVTLKDLLGDDELDSLTWLDDHFLYDYTSAATKTKFTSNSNVTVDSVVKYDPIIVPLITHTKRLYFNSDTSHSSDTIDGDLAFFGSGGNTHNRDVALQFEDLKPALRLIYMIEAIEEKYDIEFTRDFFGSEAFSGDGTTTNRGLYMWLSKEKGFLGGGDQIEEYLNNFTHSSGDTFADFQVKNIIPNFSSYGGETDALLTVEQFLGTEAIVATYRALIDLTITTTSSLEYSIQIIDTLNNNQVVVEADNQQGTKTFSYVTGARRIYGFVFKIIYESGFTATPSLRIRQRKDDKFGSIVIADGYYNPDAITISAGNKIRPTERMPKMKIYDFLTGIFKMFNLTSYYIDDRGDADYGKIKVLPLDDYYDDNPSIFDITKYVDSTETDIDATIPFSEIDFKYKDPKTLLMIQHKETFNETFGDAEYKNEEADRGKPYKIELPFEHFKFERLIDQNASGIGLTDIQWGYSAGDNYKPDPDATPQPTANYDSVLTAPALFYGIRISGLPTGEGINWYGVSHEELSSYWKPSNTVENGTSSVAPDFTINFDDEVDEWNKTNYGGTTNSIFKKFYQTYIEDVFNAKKRIFKLTAHLPSNILLNYRLNDRFQIGDKVFTINSIDTNLKTGESKLELLNVL